MPDITSPSVSIMELALLTRENHADNREWAEKSDAPCPEYNYTQDFEWRFRDLRHHIYDEGNALREENKDQEAREVESQFSYILREAKDIFHYVDLLLDEEKPDFTTHPNLKKIPYFQDIISREEWPVSVEEALELPHVKKKIFELLEKIDKAAGLDPQDENSSTTRYARELKNPPKLYRTVPCQTNESFFELIVDACHLAYKSGQADAETETKDEIIEGIFENRLQDKIHEINGIEAATDTIRNVMGRAYDAGNNGQGFNIYFSLNPDEIAALEENASSLERAFPRIKKELSQTFRIPDQDEARTFPPSERRNAYAPHASNVLTPQPQSRGNSHNASDGHSPSKTSPENTGVAADKAEPPCGEVSGKENAERKVADPASKRGDNQTAGSDGTKEQASMSLIRGAAGTAALTGAIASLGSAFNGHRQTPSAGRDPNTPETSRSNFGTGTKIALGATLAITALLIAKPQLIGLGAKAAGRSR